jgi:hypothetical protein
MSIVRCDAGASDGWLDLQVEMVRDTGDEICSVVPKGADYLRTVRIGERVGFRIHNPGRLAADVTLLYLDHDYGIQAVFPEPNTIVDNRVHPGQSLPVLWATVTPPVGMEQMVVIAVKSDSHRMHPIDFSFLAQPSLERARSELEQTRGATEEKRVFDSPLGQLLRNALYADGTTRGLGRVTAFPGEDAREAHTIRSLNWRVVADPRGPENE